MKFAVLGAGMMGCATVYDLAQSKNVKQILVADFNLPRAKAVAEQFVNGVASGRIYPAVPSKCQQRACYGQVDSFQSALSVRGRSPPRHLM